jgi:hypothetical protein
VELESGYLVRVGLAAGSKQKKRGVMKKAQHFIGLCDF